MDGIAYYRGLTEQVGIEWLKSKLHEGLSAAEKQLSESINKFAERFVTSA